MTMQPANKPLRAKLRSRRDLRDAMHFNRLNTRQLAEMCGGSRHHSTIGHLHSGTRDTCSAVLARRIEENLRMHPGSLFMPFLGTANMAATHTVREKAAA